MSTPTRVTSSRRATTNGARPGSRPRSRSGRTHRRSVPAKVQRRRIGCAILALVLVPALLAGTWALVRAGAAAIRQLGPAIEAGPDAITGIPRAEPVRWTRDQPTRGVDVSFPQCGRTLRDMTNGYAIVGLDGGMPDRPNPCFAAQWRFAQRQSGAAVYVNTADSGRGDPRAIGRRNAQSDLAALADHGIGPGAPVWLDVELPEVWRGSQARHRAVISEHLRTLAEAGYPVGVYSAPALWEQITGGAALDVPTWVGIGRASSGAAAASCERRSFGGRRPDIVQRIGTGSDGRALDRNLTCPGTDLAGLVRPR